MPDAEPQRRMTVFISYRRASGLTQLSHVVNNLISGLTSQYEPVTEAALDTKKTADIARFMSGCRAAIFVVDKHLLDTPGQILKYALLLSTGIPIIPVVSGKLPPPLADVWALVPQPRTPTELRQRLAWLNDLGLLSGRHQADINWVTWARRWSQAQGLRTFTSDSSATRSRLRTAVLGLLQEADSHLAYGKTDFPIEYLRYQRRQVSALGLLWLEHLDNLHEWANTAPVPYIRVPYQAKHERQHQSKLAQEHRQELYYWADWLPHQD